MQDFQRMAVWRSAHELTMAVYRHTRRFPVDERFGLTSQIRRAASSIPFNLVEGAGRRNDREMLRFLSYSLGSASEVEYQIMLASELSYLDAETSAELTRNVISVKKMLNAFITTLRRRCQQ